MNKSQKIIKICEELETSTEIRNNIIPTDFSDSLNEMATVCSKKKNFPFDIIVNSNDYVPPHFHILKDDESDLARIVIPQKFPTEESDFFFLYKDGEVDTKKLLKVMGMKGDRKFTVYDRLFEAWNLLHEDDQIEDFDYNNLERYL